jgi:cation-transporting ATPase 13A2
MALYSLIQYTSTIIAQFYFAYPSDFQYLYWDLAGNFFFFLTFGYTGTVPSLSRHLPNSSLFSITNIFQVVFMFVIQLIGQISMILALNGNFSEEIDYFNIGGEAYN